MKYLRKQDDPTVHIATELLIARGDMIECDLNGNPLITPVVEPVVEPELATKQQRKNNKQQSLDAMTDDITIAGV